MNNIINKNLFLFACIFLPFSYAIGILITEIIGLILILYFLFYNKDLKYFKHNEILVLSIFSLYIALIAIFKIEHNDLRISSIFYFRFILLSLSINFILNEGKDRILEYKNILFVIFFLFLFLFFDSLYQFVVGKNLFGNELVNQRVSSIFGDELILGSFLLKTLPIIMWFIFYFNFKIEDNILFLIFFFSLYLITIYLSGGRTAFGLMLILIILLIYFIKPFKKILSYSLIILIAFIFLTSIFNFGKSEIFNRIVKKTFNQVTNNLFIKEDKNEISHFTLEKFKNSEKNIKKNIKLFSKNHHGHYELALDLFYKNPIIGVGPKGFRFHCRKINYDSKIGICSTHPHNTAVQILAETGIIGFFFYIIVLLFLMFNLFKYNKKNLELNEKCKFLIISLGLLLHLFPFLPSGNFFNNWISIITYYLFGLYFYSYINLKKYD
jgi:O-antigen ligase